MSLVFFTDRDLGKRFPDILAAAGLSVTRHGEHFPHDCSDEDWLAVVGQRGWVAVTRDTRIRYKPNERAAVVRHGVTLLVVVGKASHDDLADNFVATAAKIRDFLGHHAPPLIAKVHMPPPSERTRQPGRPGTVSLWFPAN